MLSFRAVKSYAAYSMLGVLSMLLTGCAAVSVTPQAIRPPDPAAAANAIEAEPAPPAQIVVRDFAFTPSSVIENRSPIHRAIDVVRSSWVFEPRESRVITTCRFQVISFSSPDV
jgi:hypothetical protein